MCEREDGWIATGCLCGSFGARRLNDQTSVVEECVFGVDEGRMFRLVDLDEMDVLNAGDGR